jgi:hypothetical protein
VAPACNNVLVPAQTGLQHFRMKYQLVLQVPSDALEEAGGIAALERALLKALGNDVYIDGHEEGETSTSIFIFTPDPAATFERARDVLDELELLEAVTAAHRESDSDSYTLIWPPDCRETFSLVR